MKDNPATMFEINALECISFDFQNAALFDIAQKIRHTTFVLEQGVDPDLELDGLDPLAHHYLIKAKDNFLATARYRFTDSGIKIERFAVEKNYRSLRIGSFLLIHMLSELKKLQRPVYLHAQDTAVSFYLKHGFIIVGDSFVEAGIVHYHMFLKSEDLL